MPAVCTRDVLAQAPQIDLGRYWEVVESSSARANLLWNGIWTRRPGTNVFDAHWRVVNSSQEANDVVEFLEQRGPEITLFRRGLNGRYFGRLSDDGRFISGGATWYEYGSTWTAKIII